MKLAKLSLAAILAAGAFSVANATSLEDAIKGVDLSGMVRLRFYNNDYDKKSNDADYNRWRGSSIFKFTIPVSDTIKAHYDVLAEQNAKSNGNGWQSNGLTRSGLIASHLFLSYSDAGLNVIAGRIPVVTSVTAPGYGEPLGSGIVATYSLGNGLTLAGGFVDDIENISVKINGNKVTNTANDIVAGAILYNNDMLSAQVWAYKITNVVKSDITASIKVKPIYGFSLAGDYATSKLDGASDNHSFWNVSLAYAADGFSAKVGYADTNKHAGAIVLTPDAALGNITGDQNYNLANATDSSAWYAKLGYSVDSQTNIFASYNSVDQGKNAGDNDSSEYVVGGSYQYNKKLKFSGLYSVLDYDNSDVDDNNELKLEVKYTF